MMRISNPHPVYSFGPFRVDFESCEIQKHGIRLHVQSQPVRVLWFLVERPGQLVTRQELAEKLWPGNPAQEVDDSLNSTVKKLREALGDDAGKPLYIETIPRRGYRFIAPIQLEAPEKPSGQNLAAADEPSWLTEQTAVHATFILAEPLGWRRYRKSGAIGLLTVIVIVGFLSVTAFLKRAGADAQIHSIAVLPFENLSGDSSQDYFAEGLTDAVTTDLAQIAAVKVISRSSANHYRKDYKPLVKIGQELGVDAVVEGTVARSGARVRVNARLVSTGDDRNLWAQSFERDTGDILSLEDDLAQSVSRRIEVALTPNYMHRRDEAHPVNVQAYEAYLTGMHDLNNHRTNNELQKSLEQFDEAISFDPKFAGAYAGKAIVYNLLGDYDEIPGSQAGPSAEAAARRALELDPSLAAAHAALAFARWKYSWDWKTAEAEFQKSLTLNPNNAHAHHIYAVLLACRGDFAGAEEHIRKAQALDPLSMIIRTNIGWFHYFQRDYAKAEEAYQAVLKLDPGFLPARQKLWITYAAEGNTEQAATELENLMRLFGHEQLLQQVERAIPSARYRAAVQGYADSGKLTPYERARYLSLLGKKPEALHALGEAAADHSAWMVYLRIEPVFDVIRERPEFAALVRQANIPELPGREVAKGFGNSN
ncbi:MAG TPA: winged helix-turn-helix domain-containing protein [Candidatus Sulfotelmatobacter sp.]|jgi:TolB-like protein/DNA-binding winged helix-turn-helix (wHTH) protein/Tfp pilus assembly protein PilF|nr:winged helix-turn-helix domain-containing protein [Candidatus Sulfotelmatobacter sp.]